MLRPVVNHFSDHNTFKRVILYKTVFVRQWRFTRDGGSGLWHPDRREEFEDYDWDEGRTIILFYQILLNCFIEKRKEKSIYLVYYHKSSYIESYLTHTLFIKMFITRIILIYEL